MPTNKLLDQMLEHLVNDDKEKAEELFHEYVVAKSREIYESLIEAEMKDEDEDEKEMEEAAKDEDAEEDKVDEEFEELAVEADDDMDDMDDMGGDETDDLAGELDDMEDEDGEKSEEELFQDLESIVDELQAKFDELKGGDMGGDEEEMKDDFELETVREYVEKVPAGHGAEKKGSAETADNKKSLIDNMKNDMGGTTANILSAKEDSSSKGTAGGLANNKPQDMGTKNINVPGGKAGSAFSTKEPGHGAEKKGSAEDADKGAGSLFRGRR